MSCPFVPICGSHCVSAVTLKSEPPTKRDPNARCVLVCGCACSHAAGACALVRLVRSLVLVCGWCVLSCGWCMQHALVRLCVLSCGRACSCAAVRALSSSSSFSAHRMSDRSFHTQKYYNDFKILEKLIIGRFYLCLGFLFPPGVFYFWEGRPSWPIEPGRLYVHPSSS